MLDEVEAIALRDGGILHRSALSPFLIRMSEVTFSIESTGESHVVQGSRWSPRSFVGHHPMDAVLSLFGWELSPQLFWGDVVLEKRRH